MPGTDIKDPELPHRFTPPLERDDLDQIDDDETIVEDPDIRRAKFVLFMLTMVAFSTLIVTLAVFFQPEGQVFVESWPNGYRKSRTTYVSAGESDRVEHGAHRAWYQSGELREEGRYERGQRVGTWRFFGPGGSLDEARSGQYEAGARVGSLARDER